MTMEKMVIFHNLLDENARPAMERWFRRSHVPDVLAQYPWTNRYVCTIRFRLRRERKMRDCIPIGSMKTGPSTSICAAAARAGGNDAGTL